MQIQGPLRIKVVTNETSGSHELHLDFADDFRNLDPAQRTQGFREYIQGLHQDLQNAADSAEQQGMATVLQIAEQLLPHIDADEIELEETIIIEIGPTSPFDQLLDSATLK